MSAPLLSKATLRLIAKANDTKRAYDDLRAEDKRASTYSPTLGSRIWNAYMTYAATRGQALEAIANDINAGLL